MSGFCRGAAADVVRRVHLSGDITAQTRKTLDNMKLTLAAAGATLDDVVKVTVYLANVDDRPQVNGQQAGQHADRDQPLRD
jgi:2-iminobutanoate/2-iminopropanoate deaminase